MAYSPRNVCMMCGMSFRTSNLLRKHEMSGLCVEDDEARDIQTASTDIGPYASNYYEDEGRESYRSNPEHVFRELQDQRQNLLRQKDDIDQKLDNLRESGQTPSSRDVLDQIHQKEEHNSQLLSNMRTQLNHILGRGSQTGKETDPPILDEIHGLRQRYLRNGGGNPDVLAQLANMEAEAHRSNRQPKKNPPTQKYNTLADQLLDLELDNQKLKNELAELQDHNHDRLAFYQANKERGSNEKQLLRRQMDNEQRLLGLQQELDRVVQQLNYQRAMPYMPYPFQMPRYDPPTFRDVEARPREVQTLSARPTEDTDTLPASPYDPVGGFTVFYDFLLGLQPSVTTCRLVIALHKFGTASGQNQPLPETSVFPDQHNKNHAKMSLRQPVPDCPASADLGLLIQLQVSQVQSPSLVTVAWTRISLFDQYNRLASGHWRVPLRTTPVQANTPGELLNNIPKYGEAELYLRLVNARDVSTQLVKEVDIYKAYLYKFMSQINSLSTQVPPPPTASPPPEPNQAPAFRFEQDPELLGIQIDRVKYAEAGEAKVRVTVYEKYTGKVAQARSSAITCSTGSVESSFRYNYHIFGLQEALFEEVDVDSDLVLVARLYMILRGDGQRVSDESLVAWAAMPLTLPDRNQGRRYNTGSKTLTLFEPPVPSVGQILVGRNDARSSRKIYRNKATVKLNVFTGEPRPGSLTPSLPSDDEDDLGYIGSAWIPSQRDIPVTEPYLQTQGFDFYIDCGRFLPDAVTITKVTGRLLNRNYEKFGKDINAETTLDTDVFNPVYNFRMEFRQPNIPPTATFLLKVYTVDKFYKQLTVVGYTTLNLFVECGTDKQPTSDASGTQVSLNEGGHQLRLYHKGPSGDEPFSESILRATGMRYVPCASVLVRLVKAPIGPKGKSLESSKVPKKDWARLGLEIPRPHYEFGAYYTTKCQPNSSESHLFGALTQRRPILITDMLPSIATEKNAKLLKSEKGMKNLIQSILEKTLDNVPVDLDLAYITPYRPKSGVMVAVDAAFNLPWSGFTFGLVVLNPPGSFYQGPPEGSFDKPTFLQKLDMNSLNKAPVWNDGYMRFPNRSYVENLTAVIHLQEIQVSISKDSYVYQLLDQAWAVVQVFTNGYTETNYLQLPLMSGSPTRQQLEELSLEPCRTWIKRNVEAGQVKAADNASLIVRIADGRRETELSAYSPRTSNEDINSEYLFLFPDANFNNQALGHPLLQDIPESKDPDRFPSQLANQFKTLVYKVYEEGGLGS